VLLLMTGIRPEDAGLVPPRPRSRNGRDLAVRPGRRRHQTARSRRTLKLPHIALSALRERKAADRLAAGELWQDSGLVFTTTIGAMPDQHNLRCEFRQITKAAGIGEDWVPRELRHTS
jgi:integrase